MVQVPLRVLHFLLDHRPGGPHAYVRTLRAGLEDRVASKIVTTGTGPETDLALLNLRHIWTPLYAVEVSLNVLWIVWKILYIDLPRSNLIFNVHGSANIAPIAAARVLGVPIVWHFHETLTSFRRLVKLGQWLLNGHPHRLVSVSESGRTLLDLRGAALIPASVDTEFWSRERVSTEDRARYAWDRTSSMEETQPLRILMVGNLNPLKGADILLDALAEVETPWHLKIAGAELDTHREYISALRRRAVEATANDHAKRVDFIGWQETRSVRSLMADCDVFVLPSRSEACPIALLEAMSMGTPCIASKVGDTAAILSEGQLGTLFAPEDVGALSSALRNLRELSDETLRSRCSAARQRVIGDFSIQKIAAEMFSIYQSLVRAT